MDRILPFVPVGQRCELRQNIINMLEYVLDSSPLMSNLQRMVTVPRKFNTDQLQYHLISEPQMTQETIVINGSAEAQRK